MALFHKALGIFLSAIVYWSSVFRKGMCCCPLDVYSCSWYIWKNAYRVFLSWSLILEVSFEICLTIPHHFMLCLTLWGPLHLTHLDPYIWYTKIICPHFQQFLHCKMLEFIFVPQIITICCPTLKHLLISSLALVLFWESQMFIYITAMFDFGEALIMCKWEAKVTSLKGWKLLSTSSIMSEIIKRLELPIR